LEERREPGGGTLNLPPYSLVMGRPSGTHPAVTEVLLKFETVEEGQAAISCVIKRAQVPGTAAAIAFKCWGVPVWLGTGPKKP